MRKRTNLVGNFQAQTTPDGPSISGASKSDHDPWLL